MKRRLMIWAVMVAALGALALGCLKTLAKQEPPPLHTENWKLNGCQLIWDGKAAGQTTRQCYHE